MSRGLHEVNGRETTKEVTGYHPQGESMDQEGRQSHSFKGPGCSQLFFLITLLTHTDT